jgi:Chalcone isomerase-like
LSRRPFLAATFNAALLLGTSSIRLAAAQTSDGSNDAVPAELGAAHNGVKWIRSGSGVLKVFLFKVYDATLWIPQGNSISFARPLALEMLYSLSVKADDIVESSETEIARITRPSAETLRKWTLDMKRAFPSVKSGDRLLGIHDPQKGAKFFHNGVLTAAIDDVEFSRAFFKIWLDKQTKRPELRNALLRSNAFDAI